MDLLKAYAYQVVSYHPEAARDQLFAEIYDELCEEFSDQQKQNPGITEASFLNDCKRHPMKYATQLAAEGSAYLIGPQFYFSFLAALKTAVTVTALMFLVLATISALASGQYWGTFWRVFVSVLEPLMWVSATVLLVFVALEKSGERTTWLDKWDASELKAVDDHQSISRGETFFDLAVSTFALLWVVDIVQVPSLIRHDGGWIRDWIIHLPDWFWTVTALMLLFDIAFCLFRLRRTLWTSKLRFTTLAANVLWIALLVFAAAQPQLLSAADASGQSSQDLVAVLDNLVRGICLVVVAVLAWESMNHAWRLMKGGFSGT